MGKGYYFTLSIEIPKDMPAQKAREYYTSAPFISTLEAEYMCEVVFDKIKTEKTESRAEYKVYMYEGNVRQEAREVASDAKG